MKQPVLTSIDWVCVFGTVLADVAPSTFDKSIRKKGLKGPRGIPLLVDHDWSKVAGRINQLATVNGQLMIIAELVLSVSYVRNLWTAAGCNCDGLVFSAGFLPGELMEVSVSLQEDRLVATC